MGIIKTVHIHIQLHYSRFFKQTFSDSYFYYQLRFSTFPSLMGIIKTVHIHIQLQFLLFKQTFSAGNHIFITSFDSVLIIPPFGIIKTGNPKLHYSENAFLKKQT